MSQKFTSANTSINRDRLPAIYRKLAKKGLLRGRVLDFGCGKYPDHIQKFTEACGAEWHGYDRYNLPHARNVAEMNYCIDNEPDILICSNVLNVIDDGNMVVRYMELFPVLAKTVYITVYEGDKSGIGRQTGPDQYQRNQKLSQYCALAQGVGLNAKTQNGMLIITR